MKRMITAMGLALLMLVGGLAAPAWAHDGDAVKEPHEVDKKLAVQVKELIAGLEYAPTREDWEKIGPEAADVLRHIAADPTASASTRARAISSLGYFPEANTESFLSTILAADDQPSLLRRKALRALAFGFGEKALPQITPYLSNEDKRMRESAIRAVGLLKVDAARETLKARLPQEPSSYLQETIRKTLTEMR